MSHFQTVVKVVPDSPARRLVSHLDLEIIEGGEAFSRAWSYRTFQTDPFFRLYHAVSGRVELHFSEEKLPLKAGHLYLIPANVPFRYIPDRLFHHYWLHFCSSTLERLEYFHHLRSISLSACPGLRHTLKTLLEKLDSPVHAETLMTLDVMLRQLLTPLFRQMPASAHESWQKEPDTFTRVLNYIDNHLEQDLPIPELATLAQMERHEFATAFRRLYGLAPRQYLTRRRIDRAKLLLIRTRFPIKDIAARTGYDNEFFFYRLFRKYAGMTPDQYRRRNNPCQL